MAATAHHPVQAEIAFWADDALHLIAQVRKKSRWEGVSTYVHTLQPGSEFVQSFHHSGRKHDKVLHGEERIDLPRERNRQGRIERHIWDRDRADEGAWHWTLVGLSAEAIRLQPPPTYRPELVFVDRDAADVMLAYFPLTRETHNVPFPTAGMSTGVLHDVQPPLLAVAHFGDLNEWDDAMGWNFESERFEDPPQQSHMMMHPDEPHWRAICFPSPKGRGLELALNEPSLSDSALQAALRGLAVRPRAG